MANKDTRYPIVKVPCLIFAFLLCVSGCSFPIGRSYPIRVASDVIQLEWDPPGAQPFPPGVSITGYNVYVRAHPAGEWTLIGKVPATARPQILLERSKTGNGAFDFGVSSTTSRGGESTLHTSFDIDADPAGGWYLIWN